MRRIVVGIDGSDGSREALRWALRDAAANPAEVEAVLVYEHLPEWAVGDTGAQDQYVAAALEEAHGVLERTVAAASEGLDEVSVVRHVLGGRPSKRILEVADGADLLVLGSRGLGGFSGLLLGSVSQQCVRHAPCPVLIVPTDR